MTAVSSLTNTRRIRRTSASWRTGTPSALRESRRPGLCWLRRGVIASNSAIAVPRCVESRAPCLRTRSRTMSGRSSTMQPLRRAGGRLAEIAQKRRLRHRVVDRRAVADGAGRELDDRAGLDVAARPDVMADAGRHRAQRLAAIVPVGVDDGDRQPRAHLDDEAADREHLFRPERQLRVGLRSDDAVGVEPDVVHAHRDQPAQPGFGHQVDVGLADAGGDADQQPVTPAGLETLERLGQHLRAGRGARR